MKRLTKQARKRTDKTRTKTDRTSTDGHRQTKLERRRTEYTDEHRQTKLGRRRTDNTLTDKTRAVNVRKEKGKEKNEGKKRFDPYMRIGPIKY